MMGRWASLKGLGALVVAAAFVAGLGGCRLYEPERYQRLQFSPGAARTRVLFVGNSMTFYNDLPGLVQQLSAREARPIEVESVTAAYVSLQWHWDSGKPQARLAKHEWDFVVLQEFSRRPATDPKNTERYFELFAGAARHAGATPVIFQNWTRRGHGSEYDTMMSTYRTVQEQTHGTMAPIGAAWRLCAREHPEIKLFVDDRHPTDDGTYLAACVVYGAIYGKDPTALPLDLVAPKIPAERMKMLREVASAVRREAAAAAAARQTQN